MTTPADRDRSLRRVRRLRVGVVSAGVVGSLGVAGVVAASSAPPGRAAADTPATAADDRSQARGADDSFSRWQHDQDPQQTAPQGLARGSGPSHGSTGGS